MVLSFKRAILLLLLYGCLDRDPLIYFSAQHGKLSDGNRRGIRKLNALDIARIVKGEVRAEAKRRGFSESKHFMWRTNGEVAGGIYFDSSRSGTLTIATFIYPDREVANAKKLCASKLQLLLYLVPNLRRSSKDEYVLDERTNFRKVCSEWFDISDSYIKALPTIKDCFEFVKTGRAEECGFFVSSQLRIASGIETPNAKFKPGHWQGPPGQ